MRPEIVTDVNGKRWEVTPTGWVLLDPPEPNGRRSSTDSIPSPKEPERDRNDFLLEAGRKTALSLSLEEPPRVETLPLAGHPGVIVEQLANIVAAYPKVGKTTVAFHSVLDWLPTRRVLYVTEESEYLWRVRLHELVSVLAPVVRDRFDSDLERLNILTVEGRDPDALRDEAFGGNEDLVVVDTMRTCMRFSQESDNSEISAQVTPWVEAARMTGKTFVGLHHATKTGGDHGRGIAGGHALLGVFDMAIEIDRDRNVATRRRVSCMGRLTPVEDFYYDLVDGRLVAAGNVSAVEAESVRRRVLEVASDELKTADEVRDQMEDPRPGIGRVREALGALVDRGEIERDGTGKRGSPYRFRAKEDA
jgi:hypothetical protein